VGFVYNNTWEAFCKTYLELHGFFVNTNLFAALVPHDEIDKMQSAGLLPSETDGKAVDMRTKKIEADLVAYRIPKTELGMYEVDLRTDQSPLGEFFAGEHQYSFNNEQRALQLVYVEVRANLALSGADQQIEPFFGSKKDGKKVKRMISILRKRFNGIEPLFVVMANSITDEQKKKIASTPGWMFKEFTAMYDFMSKRMKSSYEVKKAVQYNDPFLELFRFFERRER